MTGERRCSAGFMSEEYNIDKLYWLLVKLGIPVLNDDQSARPEEDIVNDLFHAWGQATPSESNKITGALNYVATGGNFTDVQKLMPSIVNEETDDEEKKRIEEESDRALEEFLDSFPIIGGDAE